MPYNPQETSQPADWRPADYWSAGKEGRVRELERIIAEAQRELALIRRSDRGLS